MSDFYEPDIMDQSEVAIVIGRYYIGSHIRRISKLIEIKAPKFTICFEARLLGEWCDIDKRAKLIKGVDEIADQHIISWQGKIGRGGKPYYTFQLDDQRLFYFFPHAKFGGFVKPKPLEDKE